MSSKKSAIRALLIACALPPSAAHATLITFDDLVFAPTTGCFCDQPLSNQYASSGLMIDGGFLAQGGPSVVSPPNILLGSNSLTLSFLDPLPTLVTLYVSSAHGDLIFLNAFHADDFIKSVHTQGWGGPFNNSPYTPRQFVSLSHADGISRINLGGFYNLRVGAQVDNLFFGAASAVPAPPVLPLMGMGLLAWIFLPRWRAMAAMVRNQGFAHNGAASV